MAEASQPRNRYTVGRCRRCGAFELHRTQARTTWHKLAHKLTPLVPVRCPACGTRMLRLHSAAAPRPLPPPMQAAAQVSSRHHRRRVRRIRRRLTAAAWVICAAAMAGALGYIASL